MARHRQADPLHIHQGAKGANGGIKVDFTKLLENMEGPTVAGTVKDKGAALLRRLKHDPCSFYANLHTAEFPGGAVRGQLHKVTGLRLPGRARQLPGVRQQGQADRRVQKAADGGTAFAQRDVAVLGGPIAHTFVKPNSGTPQWVAPDRSAATGSVISRTPNGDKNIPELDLRATQSGKHRGLLGGHAGRSCA